MRHGWAAVCGWGSGGQLEGRGHTPLLACHMVVWFSIPAGDGACQTPFPGMFGYRSWVYAQNEPNKVRPRRDALPPTPPPPRCPCPIVQVRTITGARKVYAVTQFESPRPGTMCETGFNPKSCDAEAEARSCICLHACDQHSMHH